MLRKKKCNYPYFCLYKKGEKCTLGEECERTNNAFFCPYYY